jgi:hypothetical protein
MKSTNHARNQVVVTFLSLALLVAAALVSPPTAAPVNTAQSESQAR